MFGFHRHSHFSLLDMATCLFRDFGTTVTKQSLHSRFNQKAVRFLKACLDHLLSRKISYEGEVGLLKSHFNRIRIKDSTKFALPDAFAADYKGYGGPLHNSSSMISIQYEYDFLSGQSMDLRLTGGTVNDQSDSANFTDDIQPKDLFLRDLGYCTLKFLAKVYAASAYFVSRLPHSTHVYSNISSAEPVDFRKYLDKLKKNGLDYIEVDVFIGKKERLPVRMILSLADADTYNKRLRKTSKQARSCGHAVSDSFKTRARLNIMITNVPAELLAPGDVRKVYSLRWQVELLFKVWKSQATIHRFNTQNVRRFECQLYGKLIWIVLNLNIFNWLQQEVRNRGNGPCSVWKYFKLALNLSDRLREAVMNPGKIPDLMERLAKLAPKILLLEKKKGKLSLIQIIDILA